MNAVLGEHEKTSF